MARDRAEPVVSDRAQTRLTAARAFVLLSRLTVALILFCAASVAASSAPVDQLMSIGSLPDIAQGAASAPVTVIEYASMTCTHCAAFHEATWPALKSKYVDTGRVKFILREFALDPLATAAFMLARCAGPDKRNLIVDALFAQQKSWAFVQSPSEPLFKVVKPFGFSQVDFETCLSKEDLYRQVNQSRERAEKAFGVSSTPTFFVNGRKLAGALTIAEFDAAIEQVTR